MKHNRLTIHTNPCSPHGPLLWDTCRIRWANGLPVASVNILSLVWMRKPPAILWSSGRDVYLAFDAR